MGILKHSLTLSVSLITPGLHAQPTQGAVQVRGVIGTVMYTPPGGAPVAVRTGVPISIGSTIKTEAHAAVDLSFSNGAGTVRLLQNSTLAVDKFAVSAASVEIQLNLIEGTIVGFEKKISNSSRYQVKAGHEIADISGSKYRLSSQGYLVMLEGNAVVVYVPPGGEAVPYELKAPPAVYFSPTEGIKPAPLELVREITLQMKGKLH